MSLFFGVKNMVLVPLKKEFDQLVADQYFVPTERRNASGFELNPIVMAALMDGNGFSSNELRDQDYDRYKFVKEISDLIERRSDDEIRTSALFDKACRLEKEHADLIFVQQIQKKNLTIQDRTLFYEICDNFVSGRGKTSIFITLHDISNLAFHAGSDWTHAMRPYIVSLPFPKNFRVSQGLKTLWLFLSEHHSASTTFQFSVFSFETVHAPSLL